MRTKNSFKNLTINFISQITNMLLMFICRTIFIQYLATEYLGLNGLFSNILNILNLSELGVGSAIIVTLYKPLADKDQNRTAKLMNFYASFYRVVGIFVLLVGLILLPFLNVLVKTDTIISNLNIIYLLFLFNSASSYFFSYKRTLFTADQKEYINILNISIFRITAYILQIIVLIVTKNYILYLLCDIFCSVTSNVFISIKANKMYPFLIKNKEKLEKDEKKKLYKNAYAMMSHKLGNVVINNTDNILISSILGTVYVGLYSNYLLIIAMVSTYARMAFTAPSASLGNYIVTKDKNESHGLYNTFFLLGFWIYGFCFICFFILLNPFINLWIGDKFLLPTALVFVISLNFFIFGIFSISGSFVANSGLYTKTKFKPWVMAIINLICSVALLKLIGLIGVFIGTLTSYILIDSWVDPFVLFKYFFKIKLSKYYKMLLTHFSILSIAFVSTYFLSVLTNNFILKMLICILIPNAIFLIIYFRTKDFKYIVNIFKGLIKIKGKYGRARRM